MMTIKPEVIEIVSRTMSSFNTATVISIILIYFSSFGFSIIECGVVRSKNATMALYKSFFILVAAVTTYWAVGYAFAFGKNPGNSFIGGQYFGLSNTDEDLLLSVKMSPEEKHLLKDASETAHYTQWLSSCSVAVVACFVPAGAFAERSFIPVYLIYSLFFSGFIFPVAVHWGQIGGWLKDGIEFRHNGVNYTTSYEDYGYCGQLHVMGGAIGLAGTLMLGARIGRFPRKERSRHIRSHSTPLMAIGGTLSYLCLLMINLNGGPEDLSSKPKAVVNTIIASTTSCMFTMLIHQIISMATNRKIPKSGMLTIINGTLTGVVSVSAACPVIEPWAACVSGIIGAVAYSIWSNALFNAKIDDPMESISVHAGVGLWGVMVLPIFKFDTGLIYQWDKISGMQLAWNLVGSFVMFGWTFFLMVLLFAVMKGFDQLRIIRKHENKGMDLKRLDEPAYPAAAYEDYKKSSSTRNNEEYSPVYSSPITLSLPMPEEVYGYPPIQRPRLSLASITES